MCIEFIFSHSLFKHTHTHTHTHNVFQGNIDTFIFIPAAEVETIDADHIIENNTDDNTASVCLLIV